jgi:UDP-N-acetylmuramoyl-L-alanyl-D-glutamate--2,6-diaminopimelate ligase
MRLKTLLKDISAQVKGSKEIEITGITGHSQQVAPGYLFIAKKGLSHHGARFVADALLGGAVAILTDFYDPFLENIVQIIHPHPEEIELPLLTQFYNHPIDKLFLVGITGTNGKTTSSYLIKYLFDNLGMPSGLIGSIEWALGKTVLPSTHTTPERITLMKLFHDMVEKKCLSVSMEVSSHALDQGRVEGLEFDCAVFTNLTQDHLDYHHTMENYAAAKAKLFTSLSNEAVAVFNHDDPSHLQIVRHCRAQKISFGFNAGADLVGSHMKFTSQGLVFDVTYQGKTLTLSSHLFGRFNAYNFLGAIGAGLAKGFILEDIIRVLSSFERVPGRLERIPNSRGVHIFVDYAHTDDALKNVLETLREFKQKKLITVFGCGGNRDPLKRPKMARVAEQLSDFVIVTTDNPRKEDPYEIIKQILPGFQDKSRFVIELDRKTAIQKAIHLAEPDDIVLIAGKGHETTQIFSHQTIDFDDRIVAQELTKKDHS